MTRLRGPELGALCDILDIGIVVWSPSRELRFVNPAALAVLGVSRDELATRGPHADAWEVVGVDGQPLPVGKRPVDIVLDTGEPVRNATIGIKRDDGRAWLLVSATPRFEDGRLVDVVGTLTDFSTERARFDALADLHRDVERALDLSEAAYASAVNAMHEGIVIYDAQGGIRSANAAAERILGLSAAQLKGVEAIDPAWALTDEHGAPLDAEKIPSEITARTGTPCRDHVVGVRRSGGERGWLRVSTAPLPRLTERDEGRVPVVASLVDVTAELRQQEQLRLAHRREAMGDVASGIAHHFNNMLAVIVPNIELVLSEVDGEDAEALIDALDASRAAAEVVRQLLALNRDDRSRGASPVDAVAEVVRIVELCRNLFDRGIELSCRGADRAALVRLPPGQLQQAVLQLCLNARDALEGRAAPRIDVTVDVGEASVVIRVGDNGAGMDAEALRHLGEPFFTTKPVGKGTGLGLANAYATVRDAGGEIGCTSQLGVGTTFEVRLPLSDAEPAAAAPAVASDQRRVLIVDDERMVRSTLRRLLRSHGYTVAEAGHGDEALTQLASASAPFDVILLDLSMPGMPLPNLLDAIKTYAADVDLVVLSGFVRDDLDLSHAKLVLQKPIGADELLAALGSLGHSV